MTKARDLANSADVFDTVSTTELGYLDGVTSAIQTQLDVKAVYPSQTGNSGKYLTTDGTDPSWGTISAGGLTLISTATPSSSFQISFTSIPQTYKKLFIYGRLTPSASGSGDNYIQFNSDTGNNYYRLGFSSAGTTQASWGGLQNWHNNLTNTKPFTFVYELKNYTESTTDAIKIGEHTVAGSDYNNSVYLNTQYIGYRWYYKGSNITSIQIGSATQNYTGTVYLYGVA